MMEKKVLHVATYSLNIFVDDDGIFRLVGLEKRRGLMENIKILSIMTKHLLNAEKELNEIEDYGKRSKTLDN